MLVHSYLSVKVIKVIQTIVPCLMALIENENIQTEIKISVKEAQKIIHL